MDGDGARSRGAVAPPAGPDDAVAGAGVTDDAASATRNGLASAAAADGEKKKLKPDAASPAGLHGDGGGAGLDEEDEEAAARARDFKPSAGLTEDEASALLRQWGRNELEEKTTPSWLIYLRQLYQPMPIMIWIAAIIEAAIENWADMGILLGIQFTNATLGWYETTKAGNAVAALKASLKPQATAKRNGRWRTLDAALLVPGDLVLLGSGASVPADCRINHGQIDVDQSALTGESLPVTMNRADSAKMGSTVVRGETEATVESTGKSTFFGKTANLLQQGGGELGHLQRILLTIMAVLLLTSFALCGTAFGYLLGNHTSFKEALEFTVVLLVASIPIAIEIVCTTTLALGSRELSRHGAIVTRLAAIEDMAGMNMLCSDKTGTLTLNKMAIQDDTPTYLPGLDQRKLLQLAALAAKWHEPPRDALDTLVLTCETQDLSALDVYDQVDYMPFDARTKRTEGSIRDKRDGTTFKVTKGAPHIILALLPADGEADGGGVRRAVEAHVRALGQRGIRALAVAKTDGPEGPWHMAGLLTFLDPPRPDTKRTIERALEYGVDVKMITGDHLLIAKETARVLGLGTNIEDPTHLPTVDADGKPPKDLGQRYGRIIMEADGFAQVFPEHKYLIVEALRQNGFAVGMTGDGVNDAPALKRADVGVAVQGATDAARAAADIVLTQPGLSTIIDAIIVARSIFQRMQNFINYRIAATLQLLTFFFIAVLCFPPTKYAPEGQEWPSYFRMPVLMLMLITLLNDGTLISIGYDRVQPSHMPEKWNLRALFTISIVLGLVACGSSLLLLWAALDSWNPSGIFHKWGIGSMPFGKITTMIYMKVSVSDFLTLFSARTHGNFFWTVAPSPILLCAAGLALSLSTALACAWPRGTLDKQEVEGLAYGSYTLMPLWIWLYCIFWWFVQDLLKVLAYKLMRRYNVFDINTHQLVNMREAASPAEPHRPLAAASVGLTETKLLSHRIANATEALERLSAVPAGQLARVSAGLQLARTSARAVRETVSRRSAATAALYRSSATAGSAVSSARASPAGSRRGSEATGTFSHGSGGGAGGGGAAAAAAAVLMPSGEAAMEAGVPPGPYVLETVEALHAAAAEMSPEIRAEIEPHLAPVQHAVEQLDRLAHAFELSPAPSGGGQHQGGRGQQQARVQEPGHQLGRHSPSSAQAAPHRP
ncbi:hypothetical protein HXX76_003029 [Chlamydomonas incerta]|uniref:Plasma membrane ATPase n=1 Tax=Chlamydomonas incerta TaxID=51695 RepID=A0A835TLS2_CHLIN|nr:hypothetical protein HXX76_003029 [Chlamydomonas incerta]|eukprot:KAG2442954.1 hypothetical protein HXX76_003029 [Chlamydomonas incerta]